MKNRSWSDLGSSWGSWEPLGSIFYRFLSILESIWGLFWEGWGPLGRTFWRLWALLGPPGDSLGASSGVLGRLGLIWDVFFCIFYDFLCFLMAFPSGPQRAPPCPAPQRTPARSTVSRPAVYPIALLRVPPRSGPQSAPQFSFFF